jgi:ribokinase
VAERGLVVVGSLNADLTVRTPVLPRPGETVTGSDLVTAPGGKGSNQAAAAALLGAQVTLVGRVGADQHGDLLIERAAAAGVDTRHVERLADVATGTAVIAVDDHGENFIIVSPGANGRLAPDALEAGDCFAGAGVLCLCFEIDRATVLAAATKASELGLRVLLNPSPYDEVGPQLLGLTDVLVVNQHELVELVPDAGIGAAGEVDWDQVGRALTSLGPKLVIVTLGPDGATVLQLGDGPAPVVSRVSSPQVDAVDTTGCGDAFLGALAHRLALGDDPEEAATFAVRVGAYAATGHGAQASYPTADELAAFVAARA